MQLMHARATPPCAWMDAITLEMEVLSLSRRAEVPFACSWMLAGMCRALQGGEHRVLHAVVESDGFEFLVFFGVN